MVSHHSMSIRTPSLIKSIFLDFDGVIKESVSVKSEAFTKIFSVFGPCVAEKVRIHHEKNSGVPRYEKIPLYLSMAGVEPDERLISQYASDFAKLVKQNVIDSDWVPGAQGFLEKHHGELPIFLITATPQEEIEDIVVALGIRNVFSRIVGFPVKKSDAIRKILKEFCLLKTQSVMIGDTFSDYDAASANGVFFILRKTNFNTDFQNNPNYPVIEDFNSLMTIGLFNH